MSDSATHGLQNTRPLCPSPSPEVCPSSCPLHQWCHPAISPSDALFSFCPQSFPTSGTFPMSCQMTKYWSFSFSVSLSSEYLGLISLKIDWFDLLAVQGTFRSLFQYYLEGINSLAFCLLHGPALTTVCDHREDHSLDYMDLCGSSTHCLGLSSLSCQKAIIFWFHDCSHCLQWFWLPW